MNLIAALLGLIFLLVILGVLFWGIKTILGSLSGYIAEPFGTIIWVVLVVIAVIIAIYICIWLLNLAGLHVAIPHLG